MSKSSGYLILDSASKSKMTIISPNSLTFLRELLLLIFNLGTNTVTISNGASVAGVNNNSFVYGRVSKVAITGSLLLLPVGKGVEYRPII